MGIIPKLEKPLGSLTDLDRDKAVKKLRAEEDELFSQMGQDSDKAALPIVQEYVKEQNQEHRDQLDIYVDTLKKYSNNKKTYQRYLLSLIEVFVRREDLPRKYKFYAESTDEGIVVGIEGTEYVGAFKISGVPTYDLNACMVMSLQIGNTVARMEGNFRSTDSGILLGTQKELDAAISVDPIWKNLQNKTSKGH